MTHFKSIEKQAKKRLKRRIKQARMILRNRQEFEDDQLSWQLSNIIDESVGRLSVLSCGNPDEWDLPSTPEAHSALWDTIPYTPTRSKEADFALEWRHYAERYDEWMTAVAA